MSEENICARCDCECAIDWPDEPTKYCHGCAHQRVEELEPEVERLRAANEALLVLENTWAMDAVELGWFRRREQVMQRHPLGFIPDGWADWLRNNPKPGAGT